MKLRKLVAAIVIVTSSAGILSGCTSIVNLAVGDAVKNEKGAGDKTKVKAFERKFNAVIKVVKKKDGYKKIPLKKSADQQWFIRESFKLWDKQIAKDQYVSNGEKKVPGYKSSFEFLADEFTK